MLDNSFLSQAPPSPRLTATLEKLASAVADVQLALRRAIEDCPEKPAKPRHLSKILGLDDSSTWRFWQVAYSDSEREAMVHLSSEGAMERFIQALEAKGVHEHLCEDARRVMREFRQLVDEQVGDVATLKLMVERASPSAFNGDRYAKSLYDSMRYWIGAYGRTAMWMSVWTPSSFEGLIDLVKLRSFQGIRTFEDERPYLISSHVVLRRRDPANWRPIAAVEVPMGEVASESPVPEGGVAIPVVPDASRMNGRSLWNVDAEKEVQMTYMSGGQAGAAGESSFTVGVRNPAYGQWRGLANWTATVSALHQIPFENMVFEYYVEDDAVQLGLIPRPQICNISHAHLGTSIAFLRDCDATLEHYRAGRPRTVPEDVENYSILQQQVEHTAGRKLGDLHLFRWRVKYPAVGMNYSLVAKVPLIPRA